MDELATVDPPHCPSCFETCTPEHPVGPEDAYARKVRVVEVEVERGIGMGGNLMTSCRTPRLRTIQCRLSWTAL